jgi:hypothetical protein
LLVVEEDLQLLLLLLLALVAGAAQVVLGAQQFNLDQVYIQLP